MDHNRLNEKDKNGFFSKLSRALYVGNLDENINDATLHKYFREFGDIISINIKKEDYVNDGSLKVYAIIKYFDTSSVVLALHTMNGADIEGSHVRLGFGKSYPSRCIWVSGIKQSGNNNFLLIYLADCGPIITFSIDQINKRALVYFKEIEDAEAALNKMRNGFISGIHFHGDYASIECQMKFAEFYNKQNHINCSLTSLDNVKSLNPSISNVKKQRSAESHYVNGDNPCIAYKKPTSQISCTWIKGIADSVTKEYLESCFRQFGTIKKCSIDRSNKRGVLCFEKTLHAQSAVAVMDGSYIEGELLYVRLAYMKCRDCEVSNIDNDTIQQQDNTTPLSPYSTCNVHPSWKCSANDETCSITVSDQSNNSMNVSNAQNISPHKYLNIKNTNILKYSPNTNYVCDTSTKIIFNEYPPAGLKYPMRYATFNVLSLPLPEFAKNFSKQLTSTSSRNSLSSNTGVNQTYTFNEHHDNIRNGGLRKTEEQDQNCSYPLKSNYKISEFVKSIESAEEEKCLFFEDTKRFQDFSNKYTPEEFIQSQSSPKVQDQQLSTSLITFSSNDSLTPPIDSQTLLFDPKFIDTKCALPSGRMSLWGLSDISEKDKEDQKKSPSKQINKQKSLLGFVAKKSIEPVDSVENSNNIDSKSIIPKINKSQLFSSDTLKIDQTINKKKKLVIKSETNNIENNEDYKFSKENSTIEEETQHLDTIKIQKNSKKNCKFKKIAEIYRRYAHLNYDINNDNKSKRYFKKLDGNITSSYCSSKNLLKRSVSHSSENQNDSKRWKTDNKT